jgi:hypothetical protein
MPPLLETDLYPPVKALLESQGYSVKSEVSNCDVVAVRGDEEPVVVELKTNFTLPLVFQGLRRQSMTDLVYLAFAVHKGGSKTTVWRRYYRDIIKLCRMLGLGLMTIRLDKTKKLQVEVRLDPAPYQPLQNKNRRGLLLREFERRAGDPNQGGMNKRPIVTAYRQDALKCAWFLQQNGPSKTASVKIETGVHQAPRILQRDVYGWFQRIDRGIYDLTPDGGRALDVFADVVGTLIHSKPRSLNAR